MCVCGGSDVPEWYLNTPEYPNYVYAATSGTSPEMQAAIDSTTAAAREELAVTLDTTLARETQSFADSLEDGMNRQFVEVRSEAVRAISKETSAKDKKIIQRDNGAYRAYVLMEVPVYEAAQALLSTLEEHEQLHARFRNSQVYEEMRAAETADDPSQGQ